MPGAMLSLSATMLDMDWWQREGPRDWEQVLGADDPVKSIAALRGCTYSGRPFGDEGFVEEMAARFGRHWVRGRPKKSKSQERAGRGTGEPAPALLKGEL